MDALTFGSHMRIAPPVVTSTRRQRMVPLVVSSCSQAPPTEFLRSIAVMPGDAVPDTAIRWRGQVPVQVRATGGYVVIAAHAQRALEPVHPGRIPFGVTNPIFVVP